MGAIAPEDRRLARLSKICLGLPETALPGDNTALAAAQPTRFYLPAYIGPRGWIALRLDSGEVDWDEVAELVMGGYRLIAPQRLLKLDW